MSHEKLRTERTESENDGRMGTSERTMRHRVLLLMIVTPLLKFNDSEKTRSVLGYPIGDQKSSKFKSFDE